MQQPGEPLFLEDDTAAALALAEEERGTCPSCGLPKAWCRDPANQFAFEPVEEQCHVSYRLASHRKAVDEKRSEETKAATQVSARFREGFEPDLTAGLDLPFGDGDGVGDEATARVPDLAGEVGSQ